MNLKTTLLILSILFMVSCTKDVGKYPKKTPELVTEPMKVANPYIGKYKVNVFTAKGHRDNYVPGNWWHQDSTFTDTLNTLLAAADSITFHYLYYIQIMKNGGFIPYSQTHPITSGKYEDNNWIRKENIVFRNDSLYYNINVSYNGDYSELKIVGEKIN
jgi:hypothetical protein